MSFESYARLKVKKRKFVGITNYFHYSRMNLVLINTDCSKIIVNIRSLTLHLFGTAVKIAMLRRRFSSGNLKYQPQQIFTSSGTNSANKTQ